MDVCLLRSFKHYTAAGHGIREMLVDLDGPRPWLSLVPPCGAPAIAI